MTDSQARRLRSWVEDAADRHGLETERESNEVFRRVVDRISTSPPNDSKTVRAWVFDTARDVARRARGARP